MTLRLHILGGRQMPRPRPYDTASDWMPLSERELFAAKGVDYDAWFTLDDAGREADRRIAARAAADETDGAYAARIYEAVMREVNEDDFARALLQEWGLDPDSIHTALATDARVEEREPPRGGPGSGVGGGPTSARGRV